MTHVRRYTPDEVLHTCEELSGPRGSHEQCLEGSGNDSVGCDKHADTASLGVETPSPLKRRMTSGLDEPTQLKMAARAVQCRLCILIGIEHDAKRSQIMKSWTQCQGGKV